MYVWVPTNLEVKVDPRAFKAGEAWESNPNEITVIAYYRVVQSARVPAPQRQQESHFGDTICLSNTQLQAYSPRMTWELRVLYFEKFYVWNVL